MAAIDIFVLDAMEVPSVVLHKVRKRPLYGSLATDDSRWVWGILEETPQVIRLWRHSNRGEVRRCANLTKADVEKEFIRRQMLEE